MTPKVAYKLHSVVVELLRSGPPHNQLLSPLTDYLALCGNHSAVAVRVPYEQAQFERRIDPLRYHSKVSEGDREYGIVDVGQELGKMLNAVPGLSPGLAEAVASECDMTHLEVVLTPNELALLPFECMFVPDGAPGGHGQFLLLQTNAPVCMTRAVRGVSGEHVIWPARPMVLFAWAEPHDAGPVPFEDHLLALRKALSPWIRPYRGDDKRKEDKQLHYREQVKQLLTVLPNATVNDIFEHCSQTAFTHVHILAHGVPAIQTYQKQIGLALCKPGAPKEIEIVSGRSLSNALRFRDPENPELTSLPSMVTLASCDSGSVGSLVTHGASVAHDLHNAGVPWVLASQFPLSKAGSVLMAEELYRRVLQAEDPRVALHYVRRRLYSRFSRFHDWASIVAYSALPPNLDSQLAANQFIVARDRINRVLAEADALLDRTPESPRSYIKAARFEFMKPADAEKRLMEKLRQLRTLEAELISRGADKVESLGLAASAEKRKAEILYRASQLSHVVDQNQAEFRHRSLDALLKSRDYYLEAVRRDMTQHWVAVQFLCLTRVLMSTGRIDGPFPIDHWTSAKVAAEFYLDNPDNIDQSYAHASLAELYLLQLIAPVKFGEPDPEEKVIKHARKMLELSGLNSFEIYSTRRQFARYNDWWGTLLSPPGAAAEQIIAQPTVEQVLEILPEGSPEW